MAAAKKSGKAVEVKPRPALAVQMERMLAAKLVAGPSDVIDMSGLLARARIERAARKEPPFPPRQILQRAQISAPLIERLIALDAAAVLTGRLPAAEAMGPHHQDAADEIRFVKEAGSLGANVAAVVWSDAGGGGMAGTPLYPSGGAGACARGLLIQRLCFAPWEAAMLANPPTDGRGRPINQALFVVLAAVLRGPALHELERLAGIRNGQARRMIREGLSRYTTFEELMSTRGKRRKPRVL